MYNLSWRGRKKTRKVAALAPGDAKAVAVLVLDALARKLLVMPAQDASPDGPQNQIESNPAIETIEMGRSEAEKQ